MQDRNIQKAKDIIAKILYITIATVSKSGQPWNSPVYSAYDEDYSFYWASCKNNVHSKNIRENKKVFLAIYDSTVPEGTGEGVYIRAHARELKKKKEIAKALKLLYERKNRKPRGVHEFMGNYPRRVYTAVSKEVWMNADGDVRGHYVDKRIKIDLLK